MVGKVTGIVVPAVGSIVAVKIGMLYCVPACMGRIGEVGVAGYWVWKGLTVELNGKMSDGWIEDEQCVHMLLGKLPLMADICAETQLSWPTHSFAQHLIEELGLCHAK